MHRLQHTTAYRLKRKTLIEFVNASEPQFVAVLNDQNLHDNWRNSHATSVFGGGGGDTMLIFKQVGFGISLFFLFLTLAIHFVVPDMRKVYAML